MLQEKLRQRGGVEEEDDNNQTGKPHGGAPSKKSNRKNDRRKRQRTNNNQEDETAGADADAAYHHADASSYDQATDDRATDADADADTNTDAPPLMARFDLLYQNQNDPNRMAAIPDAALSSGSGSTSTIPVVCYPTAQRRRERSAAVVRRARTLEYNLIRQRWQKRKYDFRDEVDVGHAVAEQVQYSRKVLRKKRRRQKKVTIDQHDEDQQQRDDDDMDIDTFDHTDEEGNILSQLLQPSQEAAEAAQRQQQQQQESETLKPYAEIMNHWEYGRLVPQPDQLEPVLSNPSISQPNAVDQVRSNDSNRRNDDDDDGQQRLSTALLDSSQSQRALDHRISPPPQSCRQPNEPPTASTNLSCGRSAFDWRRRSSGWWWCSRCRRHGRPLHCRALEARAPPALGTQRRGR